MWLYPLPLAWPFPIPFVWQSWRQSSEVAVLSRWRSSLNEFEFCREVARRADQRGGAVGGGGEGGWQVRWGG